MKHLAKFNAHFSFTALGPRLSSADMTVVMEKLAGLLQKEFEERLGKCQIITACEYDCFEEEGDWVRLDDITAGIQKGT